MITWPVWARRQPTLVLGLFLLALLQLKLLLGGAYQLGNLEPLAESIYNLRGAEGIARAGSISLNLVGIAIPNPVPWLYPLLLSPIFLFASDPRWFYLLNLALLFISVGLFYFLLARLVASRFAKTLLWLLFLLNPVLSTLPQHPVADNLVLPLFLVLYFILTLPVVRITAGLLGVSAMLLFLAKPIMGPISLLFILAYSWRIYSAKSKQKIQIRGWLYYAPILTTLVLWLIFASAVGGTFLPDLRLDQTASSLFTSSSVPTEFPHFRAMYTKVNLKLYLAPFWDYPAPLLGQPSTVLPPLLGGLVAAALIVGGLLKPGWLGLFNFSLAAVSLLIFSTAFVVDFRHLAYLIPVFFLALGSFIDGLEKYLAPKRYWRLFYLTVVFLVWASLGIALAGQIRGGETRQESGRYNYQAAIAVREYFSGAEFERVRPKLLAVLPPSYLDYFSQGKFEPLPLSSLIYFSPNPEALYKLEKYETLETLYRTYLDNDIPLYLLDYQNSPHWEFERDAQSIAKNFKLNKVYRGCSGACNIYRLEQ
jgi:hypothetical protein